MRTIRFLLALSSSNIFRRRSEWVLTCFQGGGGTGIPDQT
jgi:hypothetical protein